jgi:hypothetical protein
MGVNVDEEPGPKVSRGYLFIHSFDGARGRHLALVDYVYVSRSNAELVAEEHHLRLPIRPLLPVPFAARVRKSPL